MVDEYPWYDVIYSSEDLMQGDFINDCPIIMIPSSCKIEVGVEPNVTVKSFNTIIMSQSCDLVQKKIDLVLVCPIWRLSELQEQSDFFKSSKGKDDLRKGNLPGYHILNKCEIKDFENEFIVVDFRSIYSVPFDFLVEFSKKNEKRLRLLPPYREHLSQAFARFFMRIGLPIDIRFLK